MTSTEVIKIEPAKNDKERFYNRGVLIALESAFRSKDFPVDRSSREYAEIVRAYWDVVADFPGCWEKEEHPTYPDCQRFKGTGFLS